MRKLQICTKLTPLIIRFQYQRTIKLQLWLLLLYPCPSIYIFVVNLPFLGLFPSILCAVTADVQGLDGYRIGVQGLQNGQQYICTMIARAVTGGVIPRSVNSPSSNPTPAFTPSATGSE